ncbi:hypothetical protein IMZ38_06575 [Thermosphaera chiliense]|uniref:Uncharacterized protein n=1 Tax=Thermosphaera chiliense TaxID=3402707 RepID=A0A7M1UTS3_9CREN|nr:hypothetical protein [Thermosphaera aggregans]QOR94274.1 hypothetical protein IMZ38_06575 [Thermosphaera aggregans]
MRSPNEILKQQVEEVLKRLGDKDSLRKEIERLKHLSSVLESGEYPPIVNNILYYSFNAALTKLFELKEYLKSKDNEIELYYLLREANTALETYVGSLRSSRRREIIQLSLPIYLSVIVYLIGAITDPVDINILTLVLGILGAGLTYLTIIGGYVAIISASLLNIAITLLTQGLKSLGNVVIHLLILVSAVTYVYIMFSLKSEEYREKLNKLFTDTSQVIEKVAEPADKREVDELLKEIQATLSVPTKQLLSYKASVMVMNGFRPEELKKILSKYVY